MLTKQSAVDDFVIRPIVPADNAAVAAIIQTVMPEFGASGPGFALHDPEVNNMHAAYQGARARYFVIEHEGKVVGGGGFAPLTGGAADVCEVQKMYFYRHIRGKGLGQRLLAHVLAEAALSGYKRCYLETLETMTAARALYTKQGFLPLRGPLGTTGHHGCDAWYARDL